MKKASGRSIYKCKVVLLGEQSVGKSSLALRFVENTFIEYNVPTIGAAYLTKKLIINDCVMKFEIWDTAGQERFHSIAPMYYRGSQAAIVVYDITKPETFDRAKAWVEELHKQANPHLVILLAGNKADLNHLRQIQKTVRQEKEMILPKSKISCFWKLPPKQTKISIKFFIKSVTSAQKKEDTPTTKRIN